MQTLLALPEYTAASRLSVFLSMPSREIDTSAVVEHALSSGKQLFVPHIHRPNPAHLAPVLVPVLVPAPSVMDMLSLSSIEDYRCLRPDSWGIPTIPPESIAARRNVLEDIDGPLDLIIMPGVAFDETFKRLGHGKGYYDYFLTRYRESLLSGTRMPVLVAVALEEQLLAAGDTVPVDASDWLVDIIVTGHGKYLRRESSALASQLAVAD